MALPDYQGGSIVNLMASIVAALGGENSLYPPLRELKPSRLANIRNIVLLVIDGLGYEYLTRAWPGSTLHQHLKARITSVFPSTTATAITTFLTGLAPQQHALTGWFTYFRELGSVTAVLPFRPRSGVTSFKESGIVPSQLFNHAPVFDRIKAPSYVVSPERIINSEYNTAHSGAARKLGYKSLTQFFQTIEAALGASKERKYVYAYYPEIDSIAHVYGIGSTQVASHFAKFDAAFSRFLESVKGSDSIIIVTADHGFIDSGPQQVIELEQHPELAETLMLPLCGERRAAYCYVHPEKRKQFETYVKTELAEYATLSRSERLVEKHYFGLGEPHPRLAERIGHYTLIMKQNYVIKDWVPGERRHVHIGVHGGVSEEEMFVPLIVAQA